MNEGDLFENYTCSFKESVLVKGSCFGSIKMFGQGVLHITGDLKGNLEIGDFCEIVIGGTVDSNARIEGRGINSIYIGGDLQGCIKCLGYSGVLISGDARGVIETGAPITRIAISGDFSGELKPLNSSSMLSIYCEGYFPGQAARDIASLNYSEACIFTEYSDVEPGLHVYGQDSRGLKFGVSRAMATEK